MPFRLLTDNEIREAALEAMSLGDWVSIRDKVLELFPNPHSFVYYYCSEYNDEGYEMRPWLRTVTDIMGVELVHNGSLTDAGIYAIQRSQGYLDIVNNWRRSYDPEPEDYYYDAVNELDDGPKLCLEDGDDGPDILATVKDGPQRKFPHLYVAVSE